jgi:hypothetical protein
VKSFTPHALISWTGTEHNGLFCWWLGDVTCWCRGSLPSQARELAREAAGWWAKASMGNGKWDLLERKERVQLEQCSGAQKPVAHYWVFMGVLTQLGGFFHWPCISRAFSGELVWFAPLLGEGNNLESILLISLVADLYLSFRMQECRPLTPQDAGMILFSMGDGLPIHLP